jgi:multimeric flavodoxin WrbA
MGKRILIIKGSPREQGNSSVLADQVAEGAGETGATTESIFLHGMDIRPCRGCDNCRTTRACVITDDMQALFPKLLAADAIVLASPIYWFTFSAQMKTCIDRWYSLWNIASEPFKNKPIGIVLTYGDTDLYTSGCINAIHTFEAMFRFLEAPIEGWVYGSVLDIGDAQKNPALMEAARSLGRKLGAP